MGQLRITVNGTRYETAAGPHTTLLQWLREQGLLAAKEGCAEGECGACAVLLVRPEGDGARYESVNSCLVTVGSLHEAEVLTVEGLGAPQALHPAQEAMAAGGGSQCGYCTPGFVASLAGEYYRRDRVPGQHGAENGVDLHALAGNLCRCTGYRPIRDAAYALDFPAPDDAWFARMERLAGAPQPVRLSDADGEFVRPGSLTEALDLLAQDGAVALAGGTDLGVERNLRGARPQVVVAIDGLPELRELTIGEEDIEIGAALSLAEVERRLAGRVPLLDQLFPQFASPLIRHAATLGGNLGTASPIGDAPPALLALRASVVLVGPAGQREVELADYFTGYRQTRLGPGELIRSVRIPTPLAPHVAFQKIAKRRFDDISSVAVAFALDIADGVVRSATIGLGGVAATPLRARATEDALVGQPWSADTARRAGAVLRAEGTPITDARASADYRRAMLGQALSRLYAELGDLRGPDEPGRPDQPDRPDRPDEPGRRAAMEVAS